MTQRRTVIFDVDDVLLSYNSAFLDYYNVRIDAGRHYTCFEDIDDLQGKDVAQMIRDFNTSDYFANLKPVDGALEAVEHCLSKDISIHLLTSCGSSPDIHFRRHVNLIDVFGKGIFDKVTTIELFTSKKPYLQQYTESSHDVILWVEDSPKNYFHGIECGLQSVLLETPFNKYCKHTTNMVSSWDDVVGMIG